MPEWLIGLLAAAGVPLVIGIWNIIASRESSVQLGWTLANLACMLFKQKLGLDNEGKPVVARFATTLDDLTFGIRLRLKDEPKPTTEWLKQRAETARNGGDK